MSINLFPWTSLLDNDDDLLAIREKGVNNGK